jgi:hypothetical protein
VSLGKKVLATGRRSKLLPECRWGIKRWLTVGPFGAPKQQMRATFFVLLLREAVGFSTLLQRIDHVADAKSDSRP